MRCEQSKYVKCESIIGSIYIVTEDDRVTAVHIGEEDFQKEEKVNEIIYDEHEPLLMSAKQQMDEYFSGKRKQFDLPLQEKGTQFQMSVWEQLQLIPYGETRSYQEVAEAIGKIKAVRAVGQANKANKLPIVIPCHRVIGKNQSLTGYAGKRTDIKKVLLELEGAVFR